MLMFMYIAGRHHFLHAYMLINERKNSILRIVAIKRTLKPIFDRDRGAFVVNISIENISISSLLG